MYFYICRVPGLRDYISNLYYKGHTILKRPTFLYYFYYFISIIP